MVCKRWKLFYGIALAFGVQGAFAGEAWLLITSDPPGAAVSVDDAYRGTTPQRSGDALRIRVTEGIRAVYAHKRVDGKEYAAQQTVEVIGGVETFVPFKLREKAASAPVTSTAAPVQASKPHLGTVISPGELEVPGRNF